MVDYFETVEVYDIKVTNNKNLKIHMYQRSRSFFDLCPRSIRMELDLR